MTPEMRNYENLLHASQNFIKGYRHFLSRLDCNPDCLDTDAIYWMNTAPSELEAAVEEILKG